MDQTEQTSPQFVEQQISYQQNESEQYSSLNISPIEQQRLSKDTSQPYSAYALNLPQNFQSFSAHPPTFSSDERIHKRKQQQTTPETKYSVSQYPLYSESRYTIKYPLYQSQTMDSQYSLHKRHMSDETANFSQSRAGTQRESVNIYDQVQILLEERQKYLDQNPFVQMSDQEIETMVRKNIKFNLAIDQLPRKITKIRKNEPKYQKYKEEFENNLNLINKIHQATLQSYNILSDVF